MEKPNKQNKAMIWGSAAAVAATLLVFGVYFDHFRHMSPITTSFEAASGPPAAASVRLPAAAGSFYPADAGRLAQDVDDYLAAAQPPAAAGRPKIVLAPHAGYEYSGRVAAYAFKTLAGSGYKRAVLIGNSHQRQFDGVAADDRAAWDTPLGRVAVDRDFIASLAAATDAVRLDRTPHDGEHALEVMVPFLIRTLGPDVKIVPLLFGSGDRTAAADLARALAKLAGDDTVIVVSSDLSHYPRYDDANRQDAATIQAILTNDPAKFQARLEAGMASPAPQTVTLACGDIAIESGLYLSQALGLKPRLLKYANSGDYAPDTRDRAVGYAAVAFDGPPAAAAPAGGQLTADEQQEAIAVARTTLRAHFDAKTKVLAPAAAVFAAKRGVFVTLNKNGELRGCVGVLAPDGPLSSTIGSMALAAAFEDRRFPPLAAGELPDIQIEVSVLSPLTRVPDAGAIELGTDGVYVKQGDHNGVFLPQVAAEQHWDKETFLSELCAQKAGLDRNCWQDAATELYVFTAQVFGGPLVP